MVPRKFHKYLKAFKKSEKMLMMKIQDYTIDLREGFVLKKGKIYLLSKIERECYDSRLKALSQETTLVLSNTRELDRVPSTEWSTLYTNPHGPC